MRRSLNLVLLIFVIVAGLFVGGCGNDTKHFTLTIHVQGEGSVEPAEGKHRFDSNAVVDLTATPSIGWSFKEWIGEVTNTRAATTTVLMEGDKEIIAVFEIPTLDGPPIVPGEKKTHSAQGVDFHMRLAPAATFPTNTYDSISATVDHDFWVAETPVTYELWYEVTMWGLENGYTFVTLGREGGDYVGGKDGYGHIGGQPTSRKNEPVTTVNWYTSIAWCNALSEMLGLDPVYTWNGEVIKGVVNHAEVVAEKRNGFRLPTSDEWELAARYKGRNSSHGAIEYPVGSGYYWTPGNYASGATDDIRNRDATKAAVWYSANSGLKTQNVGQKPSEGNGLGLFDMSGNVEEWCFTQRGGHWRVIRGGNWDWASFSLQVGYEGGAIPGTANIGRGLRFVRTHF